jgi:hypothetical protein
VEFSYILERNAFGYIDEKFTLTSKEPGMKRFGTLFLLIWSALTVWGCASTTVTGVWSDEKYKQIPLQSILVIGVAENQRNRNIFESSMVAELEKYGAKAIPSAKVLGDQEINKENVVQAAEKSQVQAVLVTRLVGTKEEQVYQPPTTYGVPDPYYRRWDSYYPHMYDYAYTPGYVATYTNVLLETSVFSVKERGLIWSAATETFEPQNINEEVKKLSEVLVRKMRQSHLLK